MKKIGMFLIMVLILAGVLSGLLKNNIQYLGQLGILFIISLAVLYFAGRMTLFVAICIQIIWWFFVYWSIVYELQLHLTGLLTALSIGYIILANIFIFDVLYDEERKR